MDKGKGSNLDVASILESIYYLNMTILVGIIAINILVYLYGVSLTGGDPFRYAQEFLSIGWKNNEALVDGEYYRLVTATFLHSNLTHLLINMYSLWVIGPSVLGLFGVANFALIYLLSGISGSLVSWMFNSSNSVGASGAIFGLLGALLAVAVINKDTSLLQQIFLVLAINVGFGLMAPSIDNWGHAGGLFGGFVVAAIMLYIAA
jgi:rhomboid protease GluP